MREKLIQRLQQLKEEYDRGQQQLTDLETQANTIRNTLLRISGAIQVLEEELGKEGNESGSAGLILTSTPLKK
jgi:prefoldin subunit 5